MSSPLHYEDLEVGLRWASGGRAITEADVVAFAGPRETRDPGAGLVTQAVEVRNQRDEVVASGDFATLVLRRASAA